ncbi:MAG: hypothetical protein CMJ84_08310 [Planctomycetes bacterium]|jgi:hypothetical protein|nr:hypothetical protein [Planctomycetota bacterium]MDP6410577.1 hypothetical protein [Planctomycetota bacterium]
MAPKYCFKDCTRVCDLSCKAAFEVDDPVDNVDCYFIWLAYHFGEGLYELKHSLESGSGPGSFHGPGPGGPGPKGPKGFPNN